MRDLLGKAKTFLGGIVVSLLVAQGNVFAGTFNNSIGAPDELVRILKSLSEILTDKRIVIPAVVLAAGIGLFELVFSGTRGGEKIGKALIGGALLLSIYNIVSSAFM